MELFPDDVDYWCSLHALTTHIVSSLEAILSETWMGWILPVSPGLHPGHTNWNHLAPSLFPHQNCEHPEDEGGRVQERHGVTHVVIISISQLPHELGTL